MDYYIRQANEEDAVQVAALIKAAMVSYKSESGIRENVLESLSESIDTVIGRIRRHNCLCLFEGDELLGTITVSMCSTPMKFVFSNKTASFLNSFSSCAYISRFAVSDSRRNTGLGNRLMDAALNSDEVKSAELVLLHTALSNKYMSDFYINRGFSIIDSESSRGYERGLFAKIT